MAGKVKDLKDQRFERLVVKEFSEIRNNTAYWTCECDCGNVTNVAGSDLRRGKTKSCGCYSKDSLSKRCTVHGLSNSSTYKSYVAMKRRINDENHNSYHSYGGRGINICDRWLGECGFINFVEDMGLRPKKTSLDRKDVNDNYYKDNCKWSTQEEQCNNRNNNVFIEYLGERKTVSQWAHKLNIRITTIQNRINMGWDEDKILSTPIKHKTHKGA